MVENERHLWPKKQTVQVGRHNGHVEACARCMTRRRWSKSAERWFYNGRAMPDRFYVKSPPPCGGSYWSAPEIAPEPAEEDRPWFEDPGITSAFKNLGPRKGAVEYMIHVGWSAVNDPGDKGQGHLVMRDKVVANLGCDEDDKSLPPFTREEMQSITFAAKMAAIKCLRKRRAR